MFPEQSDDYRSQCESCTYKKVNPNPYPRLLTSANHEPVTLACPYSTWSGILWADCYCAHLVAHPTFYFRRRGHHQLTNYLVLTVRLRLWHLHGNDRNCQQCLNPPQRHPSQGTSLQPPLSQLPLTLPPITLESLLHNKGPAYSRQTMSNTSSQTSTSNVLLPNILLRKSTLLMYSQRSNDETEKSLQFTRVDITHSWRSANESNPFPPKGNKD